VDCFVILHWPVRTLVGSSITLRTSLSATAFSIVEARMLQIRDRVRERRVLEARDLYHLIHHSLCMAGRLYRVLDSVTRQRQPGMQREWLMGW